MGIDSKESEQARAMGRWSSGGRLSVDERLLARASSCTNMIPAEMGWAGGQEEQQFKKRLGLRLTARPGTSHTPNHHMGHRKKMQYFSHSSVTQAPCLLDGTSGCSLV